MSPVSIYLGRIRFPYNDFSCYIVVHASDVVEHINFFPANYTDIASFQVKSLDCSIWGQPLLNLLNGRQVKIQHKQPAMRPFHASVYKHLYSIPYRQTVTYSQLATLAGYPKAARAVGLAMKNNPLPIIYPCHRVIGTDGKMHGFCGKGEDYIAIKKTLLYLESHKDLQIEYC